MFWRIQMLLVMLTEGEQKADALTSIGASRFIGVTSGGATSAATTDFSPLSGKHVLVWPDHDVPGQKYADDVTDKLCALGCVVERVDVAALDLPDGGDVMDWAQQFMLAHGREPNADDVLALPRKLAERAKGAKGAKPRVHTGDLQGRATGEPGRFQGDATPDGAQAMDRARAALGADSFEPQPYPVKALGPLADACIAIAEGAQMSQAIVGQCLLTSAALLAQSRADVRTLAGVKPASVYALTVADSGEGKTTAEQTALHAISEHQKSEAKAYREYVEQIAREAVNAKKDDPKPDTPPKPYRIMRDGTVEGIRREFAEGIPSQGVFTSEAAALLCGYGMSADNRAKSAAAFNSLWDDGAISVSRALAGRIELHDRRLSLHWLIQPDAVRNALHDPLLTNMGFWPRFLVAWPEPGAPKKALDFRPENDARIVKFWDRCRSMLTPLCDDCGGLPVIETTPEAHSLICEFFERIEQTAKSKGGMLETVKPFAVRATEQLFRIAAVLAVFEDRREIDAQAARNAMALTLHSLETWRAIYGDREEAEATRLALKLFDWLLRQPGQMATETAMLQIGPKPLRSKGLRDTALAMLSQKRLVARESNTWYAVTGKDES